MSRGFRTFRSASNHLTRLWARSWRWRRLFLALVTAAAVAALGGWLMLAPLEPGSGREVLITIPAGASAREVARLLEREGLIRDQFFFRLVLRLRGLDGQVKAGEYRLGPGMNTHQIASSLQRGQVVQYPVTIPEGLTARQTVRILADRGWGDLDTFLTLLDHPDLRPPWLPGDAPVREPLEGYLFPDTYMFPRGISEFQILKTMRSRLDRLVTEEFKQRAGELGLTVHEVLVLASII